MDSQLTPTVVDILYTAQARRLDQAKKYTAVQRDCRTDRLHTSTIMNVLSVLSFGLSFLSLASAQLSGTVGPLTTIAEKAAVLTCNVLDYGAVADGTTDFGPALNDAWIACRGGGLVWIPEGTYAMATWVSLDNGQAAAIQLDGTIVRTGTTSGDEMISIQGVSDFEFFSGNSQGAIQGYGYEYISQGEYGIRFIRFTDVSDFSFHGIALVDSPSYYTVFDTCSNGEIYNLIMRGIEIGETDAIDIWGDNIWVHDVEITNGDECVTIKSPASNILVESVYCNISGGCSIGSLGLGTNISNVYYNNIYANQADPAYLKTNGGSGTVTNLRYENVIVKEGAYVLALNEAWGDSDGGAGVQITNASFVNWYGTNIDNSRPTIRLQCADAEPCTDITIDNVNLWTTDGDYVYWECESAFGTGACLRDGTASSYAISYTTISTAPAYSASTMAADLSSAFPSTTSFSIPAIPTSFYPGVTPLSPLLSLTTAGGLSAAKRAIQTPAPVAMGFKA